MAKPRPTTTSAVQTDAASFASAAGELIADSLNVSDPAHVSMIAILIAALVRCARVLMRFCISKCKKRSNQQASNDQDDDAASPGAAGTSTRDQGVDATRGPENDDEPPGCADQ
jgi:hypothetical protein